MLLTWSLFKLDHSLLSVRSEISNTNDRRDSFRHEFSLRGENSSKKRPLFKRNVAWQASNFRSNFRSTFRRKIVRTNNEIRRIRLHYFCTILYLVRSPDYTCSFSLLLILTIWSLITAWLSWNFTCTKIINIVHVHCNYLKKKRVIHKEKVKVLFGLLQPDRLTPGSTLRTQSKFHVDTC